MLSYAILVNADMINRYRSIISILRSKARDSCDYSQSQGRDNICPSLSSPMVHFDIELYETKFVNAKFFPMYTMLKAQTLEMDSLSRIL